MIKEQKSIVLSPNCANYSVCVRRSSDHLSKLAENNSNGKQWLLVIAFESFQSTLFWSLTNFVLIFHLKMTNEWCAVFLFKHFCRSSLWYFSYPTKRFPWTYKLTKNLCILLQCDTFVRISQYYSIGSRGDPLLTMIIFSNVGSRLVDVFKNPKFSYCTIYDAYCCYKDVLLSLL